MAVTSVHTNIGAQIALQSLNQTSSEVQATQKRISTGYRVADATDDGAAFAVAQRVRSDVSALTTANQQLGAAQGLVKVTNDALTTISKEFSDNAKSLLTNIASGSITADQRSKYVEDYKALVTRVANDVDGATYAGQTLLDNSGDKSVINNESGATSVVHSSDQSGLADKLAGLIGLSYTSGAGVTDPGYTAASAGPPAVPASTSTDFKANASTALSDTSGDDAVSFTALQNTVNTAVAQTAGDYNFLAATQTANSKKIDSLNAGIGALVDADLSKESANLQALQIRQQLGTQALGLANQAPQSLLSLFR